MGRFANYQSNYAEEWLEEDDPELSYVSPAQKALAERTYRDQALKSVVWLRDRHRDQQEIEVETSLTAEQFTELLVYMQALRDWPQSLEFPNREYRPAEPNWIAAETQ